MKTIPLEELPEVYSFIDAVGLPKTEYYVDMVYEWLEKGMTVSEALTQTCDGAGEACSNRIIHKDAKWRFRLGVIRCQDCQKRAIELGYTPWEARYVV